jgi:hypothetical protein
MHGRAGLRVNPFLKDLNHSVKGIACMKCCDGLSDKIFMHA